MNQALQDQQEDAKNPLPHSEDDGAGRGCAGAKPSDDAPAGYLQIAASQRERGAGLARPDVPPRQVPGGLWEQLQLGPEATRDARSPVCPSVEPRPGGDVLANHLRPHVRKPEDEHRRERASRQDASVCAGLKRCADHGRHQERAVHSRSIADVSLAVDRSHASQALRGPSARFALLVLEPGHGVVEGHAPRGERSSCSSCDCPHESRKAHDDPSPRRRRVSGSQSRTRRSTRHV
jgi:hypothetical protein